MIRAFDILRHDVVFNCSILHHPYNQHSANTVGVISHKTYMNLISLLSIAQVLILTSRLVSGYKHK